MALVTIRPRNDTDGQALAAFAERERPGGYPPPGVDLGLESGWIGAWVAETDGEPVGHVALRTQVSDAVTGRAAQILGVEEAQLAVIKRLLVAQVHRGRGIGRRLLQVATDAATEAGLTPILDTWIESQASMRFFEAQGWVRVGEVELVVRNDAGLFRPIEVIYRWPA